MQVALIHRVLNQTVNQKYSNRKGKMVETNWDASEKKLGRHDYSTADETVEVIKWHVEKRYFVSKN